MRGCLAAAPLTSGSSSSHLQLFCRSLSRESRHCSASSSEGLNRETRQNKASAMSWSQPDTRSRLDGPASLRNDLTQDPFSGAVRVVFFLTVGFGERGLLPGIYLGTFSSLLGQFGQVCLLLEVKSTCCDAGSSQSRVKTRHWLHMWSLLLDNIQGPHRGTGPTLPPPQRCSSASKGHQAHLHVPWEAAFRGGNEIIVRLHLKTSGCIFPAQLRQDSDFKKTNFS